MLDHPVEQVEPHTGVEKISRNFFFFIGRSNYTNTEWLYELSMSTFNITHIISSIMTKRAPRQLYISLNRIYSCFNLPKSFCFSINFRMATNVGAVGTLFQTQLNVTDAVMNLALVIHLSHAAHLLLATFMKLVIFFSFLWLTLRMSKELWTSANQS